jgi:heme/copper-type cytochrome/quinol oxidase subunit 2
MAGVPKPYVKLASGLVIAGMALFSIEQYGLGRMGSPEAPIHLGSTILSLMVLVPIVLIIAGALVFLVGRLRSH